MSRACRRACGTATRLLDFVAFGSLAVVPGRAQTARLFATASLARARDVLVSTSFHVGVGATLRVTAPRAWQGVRCPVDVVVGVGAGYETITVSASWTPPLGGGDTTPPTVEARLTATGDVECVSSNFAGGKTTIACFIPPRFVGVAVQSGGGDGIVASVVEATCDIKSDGGDVTLGSIKGAAMRVESAGGAVVGNVVTADAAVDTAGGSINFGKLVGRRVRVSTLGGAFATKATYAHHMDIDTAGGDVSINELRVGATGVLKTRGGVLKCKGLAGDADARVLVDTGGGACAIELRREAAGALLVRTHGGEVRLGIPTQFQAGVKVSGRLLGRDVVDFENVVTETGANTDEGFVNPFVSNASPLSSADNRNRDGESTALSTTRMVGGVTDVAARKVAAAALASNVEVDTRVDGARANRVEDFFSKHPTETFAYTGFDPFHDDDDDAVVGEVLDAAEDAAFTSQETVSGEIVVETRSWIASLGLGGEGK